MRKVKKIFRLESNTFSVSSHYIFPDPRKQLKLHGFHKKRFFPENSLSVFFETGVIGIIP